jgi:hypothetical protein
MHEAPHHRAAPILLLIGDLLVLLLFVFLGQRDHNISDQQPVLRLLVTAGEFALPWVIAATLLGAYPTGPLPMKMLLGRTLNAWLVAAPLGALLRSFANGSGAILSPFLLVTLGLGGAFLLAWRLAYALVLRRQLRAAGA